VLQLLSRLVLMLYQAAAKIQKSNPSMQGCCFSISCTAWRHMLLPRHQHYTASGKHCRVRPKADTAEPLHDAGVLSQKIMMDLHCLGLLQQLFAGCLFCAGCSDDAAAGVAAAHPSCYQSAVLRTLS
jgi:hypothetical protein